MKNIFKTNIFKKSIQDDQDIWDDLQLQLLSDFIQNMEADLRYTIAELTEEVQDLKEELEALREELK